MAQLLDFDQVLNGDMDAKLLFVFYAFAKVWKPRLAINRAHWHGPWAPILAETFSQYLLSVKAKAAADELSWPQEGVGQLQGQGVFKTFVN